MLKRAIFLNQRSGGTKSPLPKGKPVDGALIDNNCQTFFRALGQELARRNIRSWNDKFPLEDFGRPQAGGIVAQIDEMAQRGGLWKKLDSWEEAQKTANAGAVVIGGVKADPPRREHGHIAAVVPTPPGMGGKRFDEAGRGPFVRDGNEHLYEAEGRFHPSTWGAVRASRAMPLQETSWYLWVPSTE